MESDFHIGDWLIRPQLGKVSRENRGFHLEPKVMEVLIFLAGHAGKVLPKERIIQAVWQDTIVSDEVLTNAVSEIRKVFRDDARNPQVIQTLPKRGYRLIAPVSPAAESDAGGKAPAATALRKFGLGVFAAVLLAAIAVLWWVSSSPPEAPIDSIAVLPFVNATGDEAADYLSHGIPSTISSTLSELPTLRVIPTSELGRYRGREVSVNTVGAELNVRAVVTGTLEQVAGTLAIRVELIDVDGNRLLWGESYKREFVDVFEVEEEITRAVAEALKLRLTDQERSRLAKRFTKSTQAYELYLRGRFQLDELRPGKAIDYFRQAVEVDPDYALAWVELANSHQRLGFFETSAEHYRRAASLGRRALTSDPSLAEAHLLMAEIDAFYDREWSAAEKELSQALVLNPKVTSYRMPHLLLWLGRRDEAVAAARRYEERADPFSPNHLVVSAHRYYFLRDFERALDAARKAQEMGYLYPIDYLIEWCYLAKGLEGEAFRVYLSSKNPEEAEVYRRVFSESGMRGVRRRKLEAEGPGRQKPYDLAGAYALAGKPDLAFEELDRAYQLPVSIPFFTDARFDSLREDPRYEKLLGKLGLPESLIVKHLALPSR